MEGDSSMLIGMHLNQYYLASPSWFWMTILTPADSRLEVV